MPETRYLYTNGETVKNIDLPAYRDEAWNWISGKPEDTTNESLYSKVAAVFRVANMTAESIANMPFSIYKGETEYDTSETWQNKVGFMHDPRELLRLWRLSLFMTNTAYGLMEGNRAIKKLRYILPESITPKIDKWDGLVGFERRIGTDTRYYPIDEGRIVHIWRLDHTTELQPSKHTEFRALMAAAGVLYYADYYIQSFFQRGGIKPTMLMVKGVPTPADREKIEGVWDKVIHGWTKYLGKVFNADAIDTKVIGEGIDNLTDSALHDAKLADIAMAAGMPLSLLLSNSANYATAKTEYTVWFRDSVIPWAWFIQGQLNEQLFKPLGLRFEFRPEMSEKGQEEEKERAGAYRAYVASGMKPSIAAQVVGIDLPDGVEYEDLDESMPEQKPVAGGASDAPIADIPAEDDGVMVPEKSLTTLTIKQLRELELWQDLAFRKLKQKKSLDFPFVCKEVPEDIATLIREKLPHCINEREIEQAFHLERRDDDALKELATALNKAVDLVMAEAT